MLSSLAAFVLFAAPVKLAASGFTVVGDPAANAVASAWVERFAEVMRRDGRIEVTTAADIEQLLGVARQQQLLGCDNASTACITELAGALGSDGVLVGTVTHTGESYLAVLKVIRRTNGGVWWSASGRLSGEKALLDWFDEQAAAAALVIAPAPPTRAGPLVLGIAGGAALAAGATLTVLANTTAVTAVRNAEASNLAAAVESGRAQNTAGVVLLGVGGAAVVGALIWGVVGKSPDAPTVALVPLNDGAFASVGGTW